MVEGKILFSDLSYQIVGCAYKVFNELKYGFHEKHYQRALEKEFNVAGLAFKRELCFQITYQSKLIGKYYLDFLVEDEVVVELKVSNEIYTNHIKQVLSYLKSTGKKLGIIILFAPQGIKYRRIVN